MRLFSDDPSCKGYGHAVEGEECPIKLFWAIHCSERQSQRSFLSGNFVSEHGRAGRREGGRDEEGDAI